MLRKADLEKMAAEAMAGRYDDYESESVTPIMDLVHDLCKLGRPDLAQRAINGEWDGTEEEGQTWFEREGHALALRPKVDGRTGRIMISERILDDIARVGHRELRDRHFVAQRPFEARPLALGEVKA